MAGSPVTVLDIATEVLSILGVYAPGEPIEPADLTSLLFTLNATIDGYGAEDIATYRRTNLTYQTAAGQQLYTLGPDLFNNWVTPAALPPYINEMSIMTGASEVPLALYSEGQWQVIAIKNTPGIPSACWVRYIFPNHILNFWPVPNAVIPVVLYCQQPIPSFTSTADVLVMPPGYQELLTYELALKNAVKFATEVPAWVPEAWARAKARVKDRAAPASRGNRASGSDARTRQG